MSLLNRRSTKIEPIHGNDYITPDFVFDYLNKEFNFELDAACSKKNCKTKMGLFVEKVNALELDWNCSGWIWLNPPYKPLKPWVQKVQEEASQGRKIVVLIPPVILCSNYFSKYLPDEIRFIVGRIPFILDGESLHSNTRDSCLLIYNSMRKGISWGFFKTI